MRDYKSVYSGSSFVPRLTSGTRTHTNTHRLRSNPLSQLN